MIIKSGINYIEQIDSTNDFLLKCDDLESGTVLYSLDQINGRGRLGRRWENRAGEMLALSMGYSMNIDKLQPIPLVAGLALWEVLRESFGLQVGLKWSNDVVVGGKKLAGILCESRISGARAKLVVGMGINLFQTGDYFREIGLPHATSLALECDCEIIVEELVKEIAEKMSKLLEQYLSEGFEKKLLKEYTERCVSLNRPIVVEAGKEKRFGFAKGINHDAGLICDFEGVREIVYSGEVSVRGVYGYI